MAEAARAPLPYPEAAVVEEESLAEQTLAVAIDLPERPLVLGGCCCAHIGAVEALAARNGRLALVWLDAHGDLNTPESSPSGNLWGMPLRMIIDSGAVDRPTRSCSARASLDPPGARVRRVDRPAHRGDDARAGARRTPRASYVALDVDSLEPGEIARSCPSRAGSRSPRSRSCCGRCASARAVARRRLQRRSAAEPDERRAARRAWRSPWGCNSPARAPGLNSQARVRTHRRLDRAQPRARRRRWQAAPEHVPALRLALPRRRARGSLHVCAQCGHHFPVHARERIQQLADEDSFVEEAGRPALRRPARVLRPAPLHRAAGRGRARDRAGRGDGDRPRRDRGAAVPARGDGVRLHGRLDGPRRRREVRPRLRGRRRARRAARLGHDHRRRAHAGGDPLADAAAEDGLRRRGPARRGRHADQRDGAPDDGRRARELREPRRRASSPSPARCSRSPARGSCSRRRARSCPTTSASPRPTTATATSTRSSRDPSCAAYVARLLRLFANGR